jgi:hypothetical protein
VAATPGGSPPRSSTNRGCLYALIAVAALVVIGGVALVALIAFVGDKAVDTLEEAADDDPCPFLSNDEAVDIFGSGTRAVALTGFNAFYELATDTRVLENASDCVVVSNDSDVVLARVARQQGSDATAVFAAERDKADGSSEDRGGGISVETDAYLNEDQTVSVGDEGFCTTASLLGASGVLVRRGDTLLFVGLQPDFTTQTPDVNLEEGEFGTDDPNCARAQDIARRILD